MPADLPAPAILGEDSCLHRPLYYFLHFFTASHPMLYGATDEELCSPGCLNPSLHMVIFIQAHLLPEETEAGSLLCLFPACVSSGPWRPACGFPLTDQFMPPTLQRLRTSSASPFSILYCHMVYTVPSVTEGWDVSQWWTKTDWNLLLSEQQISASMCWHSALNFTFPGQQKAIHKKIFLFSPYVGWYRDLKLSEAEMTCPQESIIDLRHCGNESGIQHLPVKYLFKAVLKIYFYPFQTLSVGFIPLVRWTSSHWCFSSISGCLSSNQFTLC